MKRIATICLLLSFAAVASGQQHPNLQRGFQPDKVYDFHGIDHVNLFNGNLIVTIPVVPQLPIGGELSQGINLIYNGNPWDYASDGNDIPEAYPAQLTNAGIGWRVGLGDLLSPNDPRTVSDNDQADWVFISPDAAGHVFRSSLHTPWDPSAAGPGDAVGFTADGTYMRLVRVGRTCPPLQGSTSTPCQATYRVDMGNGVRYWFLSESFVPANVPGDATGGEQSIRYQLSKIDDQFGNHIDIHSEDPAHWTIDHYAHANGGDVKLRTLDLYYKKADLFPGQSEYLIDKIVIPSAAGVSDETRWQFHYTPMESALPCNGAFGAGSGLQMQFLTGLTLPDDTSYAMTQDRGQFDPTTSLHRCSFSVGFLNRLDLPTGGRIEYTSELRHFPSQIVHGDSGDSKPLVRMGPVARVLTTSIGVATRTLIDRDGTSLGTWKYEAKGRNEYDPNAATMEDKRYRELIVMVQEPSGFTTANYFSEQRSPEGSCWPDGKSYEYGQPFTRTYPAHDGMYLSSETFTNADVIDRCFAFDGASTDTICYSHAGCDPIQKNYVLYTSDWNIPPPRQPVITDLNWRVLKSRTEFDSVADDGTLKIEGTIDTENSDFDDYGHFKTVKVTSSTAPDVSRTTHTEYTPDSGNWLLQLSSYSSVTDSPGANPLKQMVTETCFETGTGFLLRKRTQHDTDWRRDLLTVYGHDAGGNVTSEAYYGGDLTPLGFDRASTCSDDPGSSPAYAIDRTYDSGIVKTARYRGMSFDSEHREIDVASALVKSESDTAGITTLYGYDKARRLTNIRPAGAAATSIEYDTATPPRFAHVTELPTNPARGDEKWFFYDGLGRMIVSKSLMSPAQGDSGDAWSTVQTRFDGLGRKTDVCTPIKSASHAFEVPPCELAERYVFDALGRVKQITAPDSSVTIFDYFGPFEKHQKVQIGTAINTTTEALTKYHYDFLNHLIKVDEALANHSADYGYDVADHLVSVAVHGTDKNGTVVAAPQQRTFTYDARGFLVSESHPENGTTEYSGFDARGHAHSKTYPEAPDFSQSYTFDKAERLVGVAQASPARPVKDFVFDQSGGAGDHSAGKLHQAIRHNYVGTRDVVVAETYTYGDDAGRMTAKSTTVSSTNAGTPGPNDPITIQTFAQSFRYNDLGQVDDEKYPLCGQALCGEPGFNEIVNRYTNGWLTSVDGFASAIEYHPNGLYSRIVQGSPGHEIATVQTLDHNMARPGRITVSGVQTGCPNLTIDQQPLNKTICPGTFTNLSVTTGVSDAQYHWYQGVWPDTSTPAGDTATIAVSPAATTTYWARVSTSEGCVTDSNTVAVTVTTLKLVRDLEDAAITYDPSNPAHNVVHMNFAIEGGSPRYQVTWHYDGPLVLVSAGNDFARDVQVTGSGDGHVWAEVTDACNQTVPTRTALITSCDWAIDFGPANVIAVLSPSFTVNMKAALTRDLTNVHYHWTRNGAPILGDQDTIPVGSSSFDIYHVDVTATCGTITQTKGKDLFVYLQGTCPMTPVHIVPASAVVPRGGSAVLIAVTQWTPNITYQWYLGAKGDTHHPLQSVPGHPEQLAIDYHPFQYWVRITNECGDTMADAATSQISEDGYGCQPVIINGPPGDVEIALGAQAELNVDANGGTTYAWYRGPDVLQPVGNSSPGSSSIKVSPSVTTTYWVRVSSQCAYSDSGYATVYVISCNDDRVITQPQDQRLPYGSTATLSVAVSNPSDIASYTWYEGESGDTSHKVAETNPATIGPLVHPAKYWVRMAPRNSDCEFDSHAATIDICVPPDFLHDQPADVNLQPGQWSTIIVQPAIAGTSEKFTYQWYAGLTGDRSHPLAGETHAFLYVKPLTTTTYWVEVSNHCNETEQSRTITVNLCPQITTQPTAANDTVMPGTTTTLSGDASGAGLSFHWYQGQPGDQSHPIGGNSNTVTTPPITAGTTFWMKATSGTCDAISNAVQVNLCTQPSVTWGTVPAAVHSGDAVTLSVGVTPDSNDVTFYQGNTGDTSHQVASGQKATIVNPTQTTTYWARVRIGNCWTDTSSVTVEVCLPAISQQPADVMLLPNQPSVSLSVTASQATSYQWFIGEKGDMTSAVPNGTTATINVTPTADTRYWCRVTGTCSNATPSVNSESALVTVCRAPAIAAQPHDDFITRGAYSSALSVGATGTNLTYQWYAGASGDTTTPINTQAGRSASLGNVSPFTTTTYWVRVTGTCGSADSNAATIHVCTTPVINTQPASTSVFVGGTATLTVAASEDGSEPLHYQWYRGQANDVSTPVGSDSASFTTPALSSDASYWVHVTAGSCSIDSSVATVSMCAYGQAIPAPADVQSASGQTVRVTGIPASASNSYRWYRGASGDTSNPVTNWQPANYIDVTLTASAQFWYQLQNGSCISSSGAATVSVCIPTITTQPASIMINPNASTTLSVVANTSGLTYQWYVGTSGTTSSPVPNATGSSVTVSPASTTSYWVRVTGSCGRTADSNTATVSICVPPSISSVTPSQWIARGSSFPLGVSISGGTNVTYQWYTGASGDTSSPITSATSSSTTVSPQNTTNYWVKVSGTCGSQNSATITISVCATPTITSQPQSTAVFSGMSATLSVTATEATTSPMSYQWYSGTSGSTTSPIGGANSPAYTTPALTSGANYWVRVSCGTCNPADSATATVSICAYNQSIPAPADVQSAVSQTVRVTGISQSGSNTYRWYRGASGDTSNPVTNWQSANYIDVTLTSSAQFWYQLQNGTCTSNSGAGTVSVCIPTFTTQPQSVTITAGSSTTLTSAANTFGVTYQWYVGTSGTTSSPVPNGTGASVTVTPSSTTSYWVRATGSCGRTTDSATATVTVCTTPVISRQPLNSNPVNPGGTATVDVVASGLNLTYQWYRGESGDTSNSISGATGASYTVSTFNTLRVWVRVSNTCGFVNSNAAWISVYPGVNGITQSTTRLGAGATAAVSISASGTAPLHYAWRVNGNVAGTDSPSAIVQIDTDNSAVTCDVTSGVATTHSSPVYFSVCNSVSVTGITTYPQANGCKTLVASVDQPQWVQAMDWYQGPRGDTSHPVTMPVCPTTSTPYWCRVTNWDDATQSTCYTDSQAVTLP